jgi:hypothetical protein
LASFALVGACDSADEKLLRQIMEARVLPQPFGGFAVLVAQLRERGSRGTQLATPPNSRDDGAKRQSSRQSLERSICMRQSLVSASDGQERSAKNRRRRHEAGVEGCRSTRSSVPTRVSKRSVGQIRLPIRPAISRA